MDNNNNYGYSSNNNNLREQASLEDQIRSMPAFNSNCLLADPVDLAEDKIFVNNETPNDQSLNRISDDFGIDFF